MQSIIKNITLSQGIIKVVGVVSHGLNFVTPFQVKFSMWNHVSNSYQNKDKIRHKKAINYDVSL